MGCSLLMKATIELIFTTKMASLEIIFWSNAMAFYLHKEFGSDRTHRRYRRFYPIITIHISLFTTNLSEYDISFFTISHHSCNKSDYSWVVYWNRSSTEIVSAIAIAPNWLQKLVDTWPPVVWYRIKSKLQFLLSLKIQITKFHSGIVVRFKPVWKQTFCAENGLDSPPGHSWSDLVESQDFLTSLSFNLTPWSY